MNEFSKKTSLVAEILDAAYNKEKLQRCVLPPVISFVKNHVALLKAEGAGTTELENAIGRKTHTKSSLAQACALPFASKACYWAFLQSLPRDVQAVWEALIFTEKMHQDTIKKDLGIDIRDSVPGNRNSYYRQVSLKPQFLIFQESGYGAYYINPAFTLMLPLRLRQHLVSYHEQPEDARLSPVEQPARTSLSYLSGERDILLEWPRLLTYYRQKQIVYTSKNRPALNSLPKVQRNLNLREFFPDSPHKKLKALRTLLLSGMMPWLNLRGPIPETPQLVRDIFQGPYRKSAFTAPLTLTDLKGMGYIEDYYLHRHESELLDLLGQLPAGQWVSVQNIRSFLKYGLFDIRPMNEQNVQYKLYYDSNRYVTEANFEETVVRPYLHGSFFLFAAFGLCDLAYDEPVMEMLGDGVFSAWDGLRYVRRTALGDYACGLTDTYQVRPGEDSQQIHLSPDTLLITLEEPGGGVASILEPYAERIGANRFRVNAQLFLKNIRSKRELETKITLFKQVIGKELPPNWKAFFEDIAHKIDPFVMAPDMDIFKIPPENKELIRLVAQDPVVKTLVIKAEGYLVLVPKGNMAALKRRLQEFGYLVV
ncbi:MAG: hypothetical protein WA004_09295 [Saprospiraceae bacterium]